MIDLFIQIAKDRSQLERIIRMVPLMIAYQREKDLAIDRKEKIVLMREVNLLREDQKEHIMVSLAMILQDQEIE